MTRTNQEIAEAEVVPQLTSSNMYVLRFGEDEYDDVPRTPKTELLVESDVLGEAAGGVEFDDVYAEADLDNDEYRLRKSGRYLTVPSDEENDFLQMLANGDGSGLSEMYDRIRSSRIREGLMDRFMPRFSEEREDGRLRKADDGWEIDDTFVVRWNAENYVKGVDQHVVNGSTTESVDEEMQARDFSFDINGPVETQTPDGMQVELTEREQRFLASVSVLLNPHDYLSEEEANAIEEEVAESNDPLDNVASSAKVNSFTDETDGLHHSHDTQKHRLQDHGVTDQACEELEYNSFGHTGLHEFVLRKGEFMNADYEVFEDTANDDQKRWRKLENIRGKAPIPSHIRENLQEKYR